METFLALLDAHRRTVFACAGAITAVTAFLDWLVFPDIALGTFYVFPILLVATFLRPVQLVPLAAIFSFLREAFNPTRWQTGYGLRLVSWFFAFSAVGLFVSELLRSRRVILQHVREVQHQRDLLLQAEKQTRILIETSPLAILILDATGTVKVYNESAQRLFDSPMSNENIGAYLPVLTRPLTQQSPVPLRTKLECRGQRRGGEVFLAHVWISTFQTNQGQMLAAVVWDDSENLRDREGAALSNIMDTSRIMIGAFSHEVGNLSRSASTAWQHLASVPELADNSDYQALGALMIALEKISHTGLRLSSRQSNPVTDLYTVLDETLIVIGPAFEDQGITISWEVPGGLPLVRADHHSLLQVFLNLVNNSERAMRYTGRKLMRVQALGEGSIVLVRFQDTGTGVTHPEQLFRPFQPGAEASGLGLYVSRQILSVNGGDLRYEPSPTGASFVVELMKADEASC